MSAEAVSIERKEAVLTKRLAHIASENLHVGAPVIRQEEDGSTSDGWHIAAMESRALWHTVTLQSGAVRCLFVDPLKLLRDPAVLQRTSGSYTIPLHIGQVLRGQWNWQQNKKN